MSSRMANATTSRLLLPLALCVAIIGCTTSSAMRAGQRADSLQDYDQAIVEYTKALRADPNNRVAQQALEVAKVRSALEQY
jgi:tetratricopeptide (TPR) repeat protein